MKTTISQKSLRLLFSIQIGVIAAVIITLCAIALGQVGAGQPLKPEGSIKQSPGLLITASAEPSLAPNLDPSEAPVESSDKNNGSQVDSNYKRLQDEMAQCTAAMNQINQNLNALLEVSNSYYHQLQNFTYTPFDGNLSPEEQNAIREADEIRRQNLQAQFDAANAAVRAYEATTPMASGRGMGCWQGSGTYPQ